jgi:hypothetical protein
MTACAGKNTHQILALSQVRFLVVVKPFVSRPSRKYLPHNVRKNSGGKSLILRLKYTKYYTHLKFLVLSETFPVYTPTKYFLINNYTHHGLLHVFL